MTKTETLKVVCVVAVHRRYKVSIETINLLNKQTYPITIVVVGSEADKKNIGEKVECLFVVHKNLPLGKKWQAGLDYARGLSPDVVMVCGSDTWVTTDWVEKMLPYTKTHDVVGKNCFYTCNVLPNQPLEIIKRTYKDYTRRKSFPAGSGRLISRRVLNKVDWKLFPLNKNKALDGYCWAQISSAGGTHLVINEVEGAELLGIKSTEWGTITSFNKLKNSRNLLDLGTSLEPERWIEENFPGYVSVIKKLV